MNRFDRVPMPSAGSPRLRQRFVRVLAFFAPVALEITAWDIVLRAIGLGRLARRTASSRYQRIARRYRRLATRLGGVWIKVGQFLSTRVDVLPECVTRELAELQDEVPAESFPHILRVIEEAFERPAADVFASLDEQPLAAASLGQVHRACLADGSLVVVKIQRPNIRLLIETDLRALGVVVRWLKRYRPLARHVDLDRIVAEFSRTLWEEVDYLTEAEHARRFAAMFADDPLVRVPQVFDAQTRREVLTLEDVYAIKITDYAAIEAAGISLADVAQRLFTVYMRQIFEAGFFHADPHPGNLFVEPSADPGNGTWRLTFVDFGMTGVLTQEVMDGLRDLAIGVGTQDVDRLLRSYSRLGVLLPQADLERVRQAERAVFDRFWGKSMSELQRLPAAEMHAFAHEFRDLLYEMPFQVPADLLFLGRCVALLSGMCTGLDLEFNVFASLEPYARRWLERSAGEWVRAGLRGLGELAQLLPALPGRIDAALQRIERGEIVAVARAHPDLQARLNRLNRGVDRLAWAIIGSALLIAGTVLLMGGERRLAFAVFGLSAAAFVVMLTR
jgi:predicted unusual protein kinase regulating ubiquinone biosynthesis (AarF/ABC1/UbiB family)